MNCIVIPTYNERENIEKLLSKVKEIAHVIVVDDNSPDGTGSLAKSLGAELILRNERGLGGALRDGMKRGLEEECTKIATMDADLSHDPVYLKEMFSIDADLVIGSRYVKGGGVRAWPLSRRVISFGANALARILLQTGVKDNTSNFRVYGRKAAEAAINCLSANGYEFQICSVFYVKKGGLVIKEYPIIFVDRKVGKSKLGIKEIASWFAFILRLSFRGR
ncbi:dolichol-phosphate mannosyltransferase [Sulfolobales archaeon HS-7]|nr:dolichol-phosphate mannosyltransferase [Sulfolobales archaeon HS-7]